MKAKIRTGCLGAFSLLFLSGCISTDFSPAENFEARNVSPVSSAAVRVVRSAPSEPFQTLGEITLWISGLHDGEAIFREAREKAATIGADTIIYKESMSSSVSPPGSDPIGITTSQLVSITFTAIRIPQDSYQRQP